jgi:hypothetical protein
MLSARTGLRLLPASELIEAGQSHANSTDHQNAGFKPARHLIQKITQFVY